jgi:TPP-dependent pyruvate/acetoin dehydrogenase alpha subunit
VRRYKGEQIGFVPLLPAVSLAVTNEQLIAAYKNMLLAREFDEALINLYRQSKIVGGVYSQVGNEATSVGTALALGDGDIIFRCIAITERILFAG